MAGLKIAVLISGRGSNLQSLIDATNEPGHPARIVLVISNIPNTKGLERAATAGISTLVINNKDFADGEEFETALHQALTDAGTELVCLAGFMRLLGDRFVNLWHNRMINIHPSLLPSFRGLHVHERAIEAGVGFSGCTVHFVRPAMDDGPIIIQACIAVPGDSSPDDLAARVLVQEHLVYPQAVRMIADGRVRVVNERVHIDGAKTPGGALISCS